MCNIYETRLILSSFERWSKEAEAQFLIASITEGINLGIGLFEEGRKLVFIKHTDSQLYTMNYY